MMFRSYRERWKRPGAESACACPFKQHRPPQALGRPEAVARPRINAMTFGKTTSRRCAAMSRHWPRTWSNTTGQPVAAIAATTIDRCARGGKARSDCLPSRLAPVDDDQRSGWRARVTVSLAANHGSAGGRGGSARARAAPHVPGDCAAAVRSFLISKGRGSRRDNGRGVRHACGSSTPAPDEVSAASHIFSACPSTPYG